MYVDRYPKQDPQQEMILKWNLLGIRIRINPGLTLILKKDPDPALILTRIRIQIAFWISASGYIIPEIEKLPDLRWKGSGYGGKMNRYPGWYGSKSGSETLFFLSYRNSFQKRKKEKVQYSEYLAPSKWYGNRRSHTNKRTNRINNITIYNNMYCIYTFF